MIIKVLLPNFNYSCTLTKTSKISCDLVAEKNRLDTIFLKNPIDVYYIWWYNISENQKCKVVLLFVSCRKCARCLMKNLVQTQHMVEEKSDKLFTDYRKVTLNRLLVTKSAKKVQDCLQLSVKNPSLVEYLGIITIAI